MAQKAVSCVSRMKREGEIEGYDYFFKTNEEMRQIESSLFFNFEERPGGIYGMLWSEITKAPKLVILCGRSGSGKDTLLRGNDGMQGFIADNLFTDEVNFAIFDHDGVNNILNVEDRLAELGVTVYVIWVDIPEDLRRERVTARDGNSERADNCWVQKPRRIDLTVTSNPGAAEEVQKLLYKTAFLPDILGEYLVNRLDTESAFYISNRNALKLANLLSDTPREAAKKASEMLSTPHSASGMMLDDGKPYWTPHIGMSLLDELNAEFIWDNAEFDKLMRQRGLICASPEAASARAVSMLNALQ